MLNLGKQVTVEKRHGVLTHEQREAAHHVLHDVRRRHREWEESAGTDIHTASGQLCFSDSGRALHSVTLELWARRPFRADVLLGRGMTDRDGRFTIGFAPGATPLRGARLELHVQETDFIFAPDGRPIEHPRTMHRVAHTEPAQGGDYDFGRVEVPFWAYAEGAPVVRAANVEGGLPPQLPPRGYLDVAYAVAGRMAKTRMRHHLMARIAPKRLSPQKIQQAYPENLTMRVERERPGHTRSDEWLGERVMNGFNPCLPSRDRSHPGWYRVTWNWDSLELNGRYEMPNVDGRFELRSGRLLPVQITIQRRSPGSTEPYSPLEAPQTFTPGDGALWEAAKRVFRCAYALSGECDVHYAQTHLNSEQYAIAAWRNLRLNPLRFLIFPHLKEAVRINWRADQLIFGTTGILPRVAAFSIAAYDTRTREWMSWQDWKGWRPRRPLSEHHVYARAANLYWDILTEHIEAFFAEHGGEIVAHWDEVHRMSTDLVERSVPYRPRPIDPLDDWFDRGELDKPEIARVEARGALRSLRPITRSDTASPEDLENLKEACRFAIFQGTFNHSYSNVRQYDDAGEVLYASGGLRNGCMGPESDPSVALLPADATDSIFLARYLSEVRYGTILKNEDGDMPPALIERIRSRQGDFAEIGFDPAEIAGRPNI